MSLAPDGAQNERTALAWQRTALSLMAAAVALARLMLDDLGAVALLAMLVVFLLTFWVFVESRARYQDHAGVRLRSRSRGGRAGATLTIAMAAMAAAELTAILAPA